MKKEGNIDYRVDSAEVSVIVNRAMVFVTAVAIDVLALMRDDRKKEVDQVEVVGGKGKLIYSW